MSSRATNLALLAFGLAAFLTGAGSFLAGAPRFAEVLWAHALTGYALLALFVWKRRIMLRSLRRRGPALSVWPALVLLALVAAVIGSGAAWATTGLPEIGAYSGLTVHAVLGTALAALLVLHALLRWPHIRFGQVPGRRTALRLGLVTLAGAAVWRGGRLVSAAAGTSGARRRFTGSLPVHSSSGTNFPSSNWLTDNPEPLDVDAWRLRVHGHVRQEFVLSIREVAQNGRLSATLDCTGGWYTVQEWRGAALGGLLDRAGMRPGAQSMIVRSATGYWRRYTLAEARRSLLATQVGGQPLGHGHGAPLRLVVPGKRGYDWVKWVTDIEVSTASPLLNWPLPVQ